MDPRSSSTTTICVPSLRISLSKWKSNGVPGPWTPRALDNEDGRPHHRHQRLLWEIVLGRDGANPASVTVVRNGPDLTRLRRTKADSNLKGGRPHMAAYLGVMGPQDGVDLVLEVADHIVHGLGRRDIGFTLIGSGDCFDELVALSRHLDLSDFVKFTGRIPDDDVAAILSTADVGISPDPKNPLNDVSTMNKTMEYMAFAFPSLHLICRRRASRREMRLSMQPRTMSLSSHGSWLTWSMTSRDGAMGMAGRRVERELAWKHQAPRYFGSTRR